MRVEKKISSSREVVLEMERIHNHRWFGAALRKGPGYAGVEFGFWWAEFVLIFWFEEVKE